jgi:hypothetical protein
VISKHGMAKATTYFFTLGYLNTDIWEKPETLSIFN